MAVTVIAALANLIPGVVNTIGSLVKNKKNKKAETAKLLPALMEDKHNIADGLELSSKTVFGYGIGGIVITYALSQDLSQIHNLVVLCVGAVLVIGVTVAKALEKKD